MADAAELRDAAHRWRGPVPPAAGNSNVLVFIHPKRVAAPTRLAPEPDASGRPAPPFRATRRWPYWAGLLLLSAAVHASFYFPFGSEPPAMASVGEVSVSVELVLGANQDAGLVPDGGVAEVSAAPPAQAPVVAPEETPELKPVERPAEKAQEKPIEAAAPPQQIAALTRAEEAAPPPVATQPVVAQPPAPAQVQAAPLVDTGGELVASLMPEQSQELKAVEKPPEVKAVEKPTPKKPAERTVRDESREPPPTAVRGERNDSRARTAASTAAGGIGRGSSDADSNYRGRVAAQLSRHKRFPAEARHRGVQGTAAVTFSIDTAGKVTSVALVRASGIASLDHEATDMVRRASPFPPPPGGRELTFTVPVSFRLN